jgi:hypothetical protein
LWAYNPAPSAGDALRPPSEEGGTPMSRFAFAASVLLALATLASPSRAQAVHEDARFGFKIRAPKDFGEVPLKPDEEWIVARWMSSKAYFQNDPTTGYTHDLKPEMHVICFLDAKVNDTRPEIDKKTDKETETLIIRLKNPYKDYRDYLKRTYSEGGYYIDKEEKAEVEGVKVEQLEIKVERGTYGGPRKIVTWIFDAPDADFAVQFEMFESTWAKLKSDVVSSLRSFRLIARAGAAPAGASTGSGVVIKDLDKDDSDLTPAARTRSRLEDQRRAQERVTSGLVEGWNAKRFGRVFCVYHGDEKIAQRYAADATAVLDFLDESFAWLGQGEYVREPTIRICKDSDEERMYSKGGTSFFWSITSEIVTHKDLDRGGGWTEGGYVNQAVCRHWFRERSGELLGVMPMWLQRGLDEAFMKSRSKGKNLEFFDDSYERVEIAEQVRAGKMSTLRELITLDSEEIFKDYNKRGEVAAATRFFLTGPKKAKETLKTYLQALLPLAKKRDEELKKQREANAKSAKPKTEEEEDAAFKAAHQDRDNEEKKFLEDAQAKAFGAWTDADWKSLEAAYQKSIK